jgi:YVTN family beta-propeller protein
MRPPLLVALLACSVSTGSLAEPPAVAPGASGYHLEATWKPGGDGGWDYLCVDSAAHRLYITRPKLVQVIDLESGKLVGEVPGLDGGHGVALAADCNRGFVSSGKNDTVVAFDLKTLQPIGAPIAVGHKPDAIIYDPASKHVFAFDGQSDDATVIDAATAKVVGTIPLGGAPEFAATDGTGTVYVNLEDKSEIVAVDTQKNAVTHRWPLAPGEGPSGLALDVANHRLFAGCHNEMMAILDAGSGKVLATPPIGKGVDACAFDPGTGLAFASCGDGTVTVIKDEAPALPVLEKVATKTGARTMALDTATHAVYLVTADFAPMPAAAPGEKHTRPSMVPGTFVVLKFVR